MLIPNRKSPSPPHPAAQGVALILTLTATALIAFLVLAIVTVAFNEEKASINESEIIDSRTLAEMPANVVISQIRRATEEGTGQNYTWASQPGMIRVFSEPPPTPTEGQTPPPRKQFFYPLYSTRTLYGTESTFKIADEVSQLQSWNQLPGLFTDLNEPVEYFPPKAIRNAGSSVQTQKGTLIYPIVDPTSIGGNPDQPIVDGVSITGTPPGVTERNRMPMPVMWLYVLSDGTLVTPLSGAADGRVRFDASKFQSRAGLPIPTIVGRIAYWTDDESCKVNVNTASEPAPWVPPHTSGPRERDYAETEPARGEYHRLPGHPAFTALAPVFRGMGTPNPEPMMVPVSQPLLSRGVNDFKDHMDLIHGLIPRGNEPDTGTEHGTEPLTLNPTLATERRPRLFADLDEMLFDIGGKNNEDRMRNGASSQLPGGFAMDQADIRRGRFYLSTHSNSPELNPFNLPKISLWPVMEESTERSRFDHEMALAATLGGESGTNSRPLYMLQRGQAWSGSGAPGSSQSRHDDRTVPRNLDLYRYMLEMTGDKNDAIPGYAANFADKLGQANRDQVLTMMFDTLRWIANSENAWADDGNTFEYLPPTDPSRNAQLTGAASAVPIARATAATTSGEVKGLGRFPTISQVALVLVATDAEKNSGYDDQNPDSAYFKDEDADGYADKITKMRAFFIVEPFNPNPGHPAVSPSLRYQIEMPADFTINGRDLNLDNGGTISAPVCLRATFSPAFPGLLGSRQLGGNASAYTGMASLFVTANGIGRKAVGFLDEDLEFPWASASEATFPTAHDAKSPLTFGGSEISIHIRTAQGAAAGSEIIQTVKVDFAQLAADTNNIHFPCPKLKASKPETVPEKDPRNIWSRFEFEADARIGAEPQGVQQKLIQPGDVVRAMEIDPLSACGGDMRIVAAQKEVPASWFRPVRPATATLASLPGSNTNPDSPELHHLREGAYTLAGQLGYSWGGPAQAAGTTVPQATLLTGGTLLPGVAPAPFCVSAVLPSLQGAIVPSDPSNPNGNLRLGDWNTGAGTLEDGPYGSDLDLGNAITELSATRSDPYVDSLMRRGGLVYQDVDGISRTPQRQISSAIAFGSLPSRVHDGPHYDPAQRSTTIGPQAWRTLLFCPNPASRIATVQEKPTFLDHPGFADPPDHLWLEFFWMPTVRPRLLSPGFSTEGKINMNYQILPFTWINRATGMYAALQGVRIPAIATSSITAAAGLNPSQHVKSPAGSDIETLYEVNAKETLRAFQGRFDEGNLFLYPSEICEMYLMPKRQPNTDYEGLLDPKPADPTSLKLPDVTTWWTDGRSDTSSGPGNPLDADAFEATGDNLRESPYAQLYPRLCTKSNVFRVHYRVQVLRQSRSAQPGEWNEAKDRIVSEQRGATVIERYLDPEDPNIPDAVNLPGGSEALNQYYRYRIISHQPFAP
jgi:uncharacterized protein (TIGR02600 family)